MADKEAKTHAFSLLNGNYKASGTWYSSILVSGRKVVLKEPTGSGLEAGIKLGDFGEADPEIVKTTGRKSYNIELSYTFGNTFTDLGVVSDDGMKITAKGMMGITCLEWVTEEEIAALEAEGDPIEAPPGPYMIQPEHLGKFLWITGAPGLGKSTSAQLLSKTAGYVYYETDCFGSCRNPYIPTDVPNPSMAQVNQKPLKGEGLAERIELCKNSNDMFEAMFKGEDYDKDILKKFYCGMCEDILRERTRIGGDWAIAGVAFTRELRDHIRSRLGPDLVFVILNMDMEEVKKRVKTRHHGEDQANEMMEPINKLCDPIGEDEENAVSVTVTTAMSEEDVHNKILELVN